MTTLPPQPPTSVPPPPAAPGVMPPPVPHAPAPTSKSKTTLIVGIVAGVVAIGGLVGFLVSRGSGGNEAVAVADVGTAGADAPAFDIGSPPVAPAVPGAGDVPTQVTLPGPDVDPPVTSAPAPPTTPIGDPPPSTDTVVNPPPTTAAAGGGSTGGGSTGGGTSGSVQYADLAVGVRVPVPSGFEIRAQEQSFVWMTGSYGEFTVQMYNAMPAADAANQYLTGVLGTYLSDLQYTAPQPIAPGSSLLVEVLGVAYKGNLVSQQGGSTPFEGVFFVNVRADGIVIVQDMTWMGPTPDLAPPPEFEPSASYFLDNFVYG